MKPENMKRLIELVIKFPNSSEMMDHKRCFKIPFVSCEILSSEVDEVSDMFFRNGGEHLE